ncbi:hypothetical protein SHKM778_45130 [Streptomyces sp. KM77-8]|uniref:Helicase-associated domain-containing protein n=1 Tax=Streptomyces haneummycinicus TaxID=3074435 RepID=A0AAT9HL88_9ACTN
MTAVCGPVLGGFLPQLRRSEDHEEREHKLGHWIGKRRSEASTLAPQRMELLSASGMRWS